MLAFAATHFTRPKTATKIFLIPARGGFTSANQSLYKEWHVCCLFGSGDQTTGWIPSKFGMDHPLGPENFFGGGFPSGVLIWKNTKISDIWFGTKKYSI